MSESVLNVWLSVELMFHMKGIPLLFFFLEDGCNPSICISELYEGVYLITALAHLLCSYLARMSCYDRVRISVICLFSVVAFSVFQYKQLSAGLSGRDVLDALKRTRFPQGWAT